VVLAVCMLPLMGQGREWRGPAPTGPDPDFSANNKKYDGRFTYARYRYTPTRKSYGGGGGFFGGINYFWDHDYPRADHHFPVIIDELTTIHGDRDHSNILAATDPELFKYPFAYMCEPGFWTLSDTEAMSLRAYLLKGGFIIVDDFRGGYAFQHFVDVLHQVLPDAQPIELTAAHPIFHSFFEIDSLNRVPPYGWELASYFGIFEHNDPTQRMMMIVNYNNDISESWEWSDQGFIPIDLTNENYKLGVNYLVYAMTH
jgi:hypothetical protein